MKTTISEKNLSYNFHFQFYFFHLAATKFQLFEEIQLFESAPITVWLELFTQLRQQSGQKPQSNVPQNSTATLHQLARRINAQHQDALRSPCTQVCTQDPINLNPKRQSMQHNTSLSIEIVVHRVNANRIRFNMQFNHNKLCT